MITEVWFTFRDDDDVDTIKFQNPSAEQIVVPCLGEKVGIRNMTDPPGKHYKLDYVVDIRHFIFLEGEEWKQEIHVLYAPHP
jgi:hypothetical protein